MSTPDDVPDDAEKKDIPSILPLAPGGVYAVKWETRVSRAEPLKIVPVPYAPPYAINDANPQCFFELRAGGYYLGRVVFEVKEDVAPITAKNFAQLCEYGCYAGTMFKVYPSNWIVGGDFTKLDEVIYNGVKDDPRFSKYFKMEKMGVPRPAVALKLQQETGADPSLLDNPDAPAPPGGAPEEDSEDSD